MSIFNKKPCEQCKKLRAHIKKLESYAQQIKIQHDQILANVDAEIEKRMLRRKDELQRREKKLRDQEYDLHYREDEVEQNEYLLKKYKDDLYYASQHVAHLRDEKQILLSQIKKARAAHEKGDYVLVHEILLYNKTKKRRRSKTANFN